MKKKNLKKLKQYLRRIVLALKSPLTYCYILLPVIFIILIKATYKAEKGISMSNIDDGIWHFIVAFVAGYFDFTITTRLGRIYSLIMLLSGILLFSTITAKIASIFVDLKMKKDKGLKKLVNINKHFLLCGWRNGFDDILECVLNSNSDLTPEQIVLVNEAPPEQVAQLLSQNRFKGLNYISGDFSDEETLLRAKIKTAERALIIADQSKQQSQLEMDSRTVLTVLTMKNLNPELYTAAELFDSKFENHLHLAHCDEVILTNDYENSLLATASSGMGYSNVIRELIGDDAVSGILIENIPENFIGKTYKEFADSLKNGAVLIGLLLNTGNFYQRRRDAVREAQKNPDVSKIVDNLRKVKTLKSNKPYLTPPADFVIQANTKAIFVKGKPEKI